MHESSSFPGLPVAIMCNKQDLPNAMSVDEVTRRMRIRESESLSKVSYPYSRAKFRHI